MPKQQLKGTEFDNFFISKPDIIDLNKDNLQNVRKTELQNNVITELQNNIDSQKIDENVSTKILKNKVIAKRDDPNYMRVTTAINKKTLKIIKDYMWVNEIKNFDDALELFISTSPIN